MTRYQINKKADELCVGHAVAMLIYEHSDSVDEFVRAIEAYANGEGFVIAD